ALPSSRCSFEFEPCSLWSSCSMIRSQLLSTRATRANRWARSSFSFWSFSCCKKTQGLQFFHPAVAAHECAKAQRVHVEIGNKLAEFLVRPFEYRCQPVKLALPGIRDLKLILIEGVVSYRCPCVLEQGPHLNLCLAIFD